MTERSGREPRQVGGELVIPVAAVLFTLYFFSTIWNSPWTAQVSAFLIGGILLALCAGFIVRTLLLVRAGRARLGTGGLAGREDLRNGRLGLALATLAYVLLIDRGGFTLTTFGFLVVGMAVLSRGRRLWLVTLIAASMSLAGWALFVWMFDTRFPRGWFEETMKAVLAHG